MIAMTTQKTIVENRAHVHNPLSGENGRNDLGAGVSSDNSVDAVSPLGGNFGSDGAFARGALAQATQAANIAPAFAPPTPLLAGTTTASGASQQSIISGTATGPTATKAGSVVAAAGQQINVSSLFTAPSGNGSPTYLVVDLLDRKEYTAASNGNMGALSGNGHSIGFSYDTGGDNYTTGITFTYNASTRQYTNSTYGNFSNLTFTSSTNTNDNVSLSIFTTNTASITADPYHDPYAMEWYSTSKGGSYASYLGTVSVVTQPSFAGQAQAQATPDSIAAAAQSFVGKTWNDNGCWVLASNISAEAGASLPITSTYLQTAGINSGEWIVAYNGPAGDTRNWQSMVTAGEDVVAAWSGGGGHIMTVVSGSGSSAMLIDNSGPSANDGSSADIRIQGAHLASSYWGYVAPGSVVIYELDCPVISVGTATSSVAATKTEALAPLFSAVNPLAGQAITQYQFYDAGSGGGLLDSFMVGGTDYVARSASSAITVAASSLSSVCLLAGNMNGSDTVDVRAYNGQYWGDWRTMTVNIGGGASAAALTGIVASSPSNDLNAGKTVTFTLNMNSAVTVAGNPTLTLSDGGTATYAGGSGTKSLTFATTVLAGQNTAVLTVTAVNLPNGSAINSAIGMPVVLALNGFSQSGPQIDTIAPNAPVISGVTATSGAVATISGTAEANSTVTIYDNASTKLGTVAANGGGAWKYVTGKLSGGLNVFTATATDQAGNKSGSSSGVFEVAVGNQTLAGQAGAASAMVGTGGADTFYVYNAADRVAQVAGGNGTVIALANYTLPANVDTLEIAGNAAQGTGNNDSINYLYDCSGVASVLTAGSGTDLLEVEGTAGATLVGGSGKDTFRFLNKLMGQDTVKNFVASRGEVLQFNSALFSSYAAAMADAKQVGANTVFTVDAHDSVTLQNVTRTSLTANNFKFS